MADDGHSPREVFVSQSRPVASPHFKQQAEKARFLTDVLRGLLQAEKAIPCKWLYDERGSSLFEQICKLDVYYPTRTELAMTEEHAAEIAELIGPRARLVELGSGSSTKTRILLSNLIDLHAYVPVDISSEHLEKTSQRLAREYPRLRIAPLAADYQQPLALPASSEGAKSTAIYFPGSTIGNFEPSDAMAFLNRLGEHLVPNGGLLIGTDLAKDPSVIEAAYDDPEGVTAEFNRNVLRRMQRELGAKLSPEGFRHRAFYERDPGRIVMQLVSIGRQRIEIGGSVFLFRDGEPITTEHSYKYEPDAFAEMARKAGLRVGRAFYDERRYFAVNWLIR